MRQRNHTRLLLIVPLILIFFVLLGILSGAAATNIITSTGLSQTTYMITANDLKPAICTMDLANIIVDSNGTQGNDLILGSAGDDTGGSQLKGLGGDDCILGGDGNDKINGGGGNDIILGGGGDDDISGGQDDDYMDGGSGNDSCDAKHGNDTTNNCETVIN